MSFTVGAPWIQSLRAGYLGNFVDFKSLMNWRNASTETYNFQSATLSIAVNTIPTCLFRKIACKKLQRLTYGSFKHSGSNKACFSLTAEYEFNTLTLNSFCPEVIKLPNSCTTLEIDFLSHTFFGRTNQLCNMNPKITTLTILACLEIFSDTNRMEFLHIRNLHLIDCGYCGFFPQVRNVHIGLPYGSDAFVYFDMDYFPCLECIYVHVPVVADISRWPVLSTKISVFVSIELTDDWSIFQPDFCLPCPYHEKTWFRWGHAKGNMWSAYCKYDEIPKSVLQYKCLSL